MQKKMTCMCQNTHVCLSMNLQKNGNTIPISICIALFTLYICDIGPYQLTFLFNGSIVFHFV
jgi:hypothetical protein